VEEESGGDPGGRSVAEWAVACRGYGGDTVSVVDPESGSVVGRVVTGRGAHNLFLSPDRKRLYVCNRVDGTLSVLDPTTLAVRQTIAMPGGPDDMDFAPDGTIWISRRFAHSVAVLDPASGRYSLIQVGRSPHGIWLNPAAEIAR
jgi:YVTN family beta-propeller protein